MRTKELRRVHVIRQVMEKTLPQKEAGTMLGLTDRQIRHLLERVKEEGDQGLVHRGHGKSSNRRIPEKRKKTVLALYEERYGDFGPTLAVEKLAERDGIPLGAGVGYLCFTVCLADVNSARWSKSHVVGQR